MLFNLINFLKPPASRILVLFLITENQIKLTYKLRVNESQALALNEYSNDLHEALITRSARISGGLAIQNLAQLTTPLFRSVP